MGVSRQSHPSDSDPPHVNVTLKRERRFRCTNNHMSHFHFRIKWKLLEIPEDASIIIGDFSLTREEA